ncbi:hypothetical protein KSW81_003724 [Nannochloris sp. 'desiccata']|nr:hypothetical protein KSW81_003724 [Chlorella desiccata (nom. nud.)]
MRVVHSLLLVALLAVAATAQDCSSGFDPACPNLVFAATVTTPTCPSPAAWDDETASCWLPCSSHNTVDISYVPHDEDMHVCVPTCPQGTLPKPGVDGFSTQCIQCPAGSPIVSGKKGNWVCRRGGQTTLPIRSIAMSHRLRQEVDGGCPADANSARQYMFWQAEGATFCVPDICCSIDSALIEGGGCASGDCDENFIDEHFDLNYGI